mmetsp:Transcript_27378/g.59427  ORF Transcript_27378/g.59427 Transcript_27378/m.59427 type:complete len:180 (-) Transcript_27378:252-791(-)
MAEGNGPIPVSINSGPALKEMKSTTSIVALAAAVALSCCATPASAFMPSPSKVRPTLGLVHPRDASTTALSAVINKSFGRAVECAETFGLCDPDECAKLATQLEDFEGCVYEDGKEACDKEIQDRKDVAETLRMAAELQLRMNYLQKANLFAEDVHKELEVEHASWSEYKEAHGTGVGL